MRDAPPVHKIKGYGTGNIYIIEDEEIVLVDTGIARDSKLVLDRLRRLGISAGDVGHILLTHFHVDHAGAARHLKETTGASVYAHEGDTPCLQGDVNVPSIFKKGVIGRAVSLAPGVARRMVQVPAVRVDEPLADGDVIPILDGIRVIHSPGHTMGSACFFWPRESLLFTGDTIINTYHVLTLPTEGFSCDFDLAATSAGMVAHRFESEDLRMLCPGHGPIVENEVGRKLRKFSKHLEHRG